MQHGFSRIERITRIFFSCGKGIGKGAIWANWGLPYLGGGDFIAARRGIEIKSCFCWLFYEEVCDCLGFFVFV